MIKQDKSYDALIEDIEDETALFANTSAYLNQVLDNINWVGFYILRNSQLVLGPFQGKVACVTIQLDKGVCGHCATIKQPIIVDDVHQFEGHIACDEASQSEMVIPILIKGELYGVLDIDAPIKARFSQQDLDYGLEIINSLSKKLEEILTCQQRLASF